MEIALLGPGSSSPSPPSFTEQKMGPERGRAFLKVKNLAVEPTPESMAPESRLD